MTAQTADNAPMATLAGIATSRGFVAGEAFVCGVQAQLPVPEDPVPPEGVEDEIARFRAARGATRIQLEMLISEIRASGGSSQADIFVSHLALMQDPVVVSSVEDAIRQGRNAAAAVRDVLTQFRAMFDKMKDPYLRERVRDVDDVERRLLRVLLRLPEQTPAQIDRPVIVVAPDLTPSETISLPRRYVLGIATDRGSSTSHVALLARSLGIPAVVGLGDVTARVRSGDRLLLDGTNGAVTLHPDGATRRSFDRLVAREAELTRLLEETVSAPAALKDGTPVGFLANAQPGMPLGALKANGAQGVGLYRSEYLWLGSEAEPTEDDQFADYAEAVKAVSAQGGRVVFRTMDLGGDKLRPGKANVEPNPFLGCRSIRWSLANREQFRTQLRAILRASALGPAALMFPMVATLRELEAAKAEVRLAMQELDAEKLAYDARIPIGIMVEIPAAALNAEAFARECDFFSIGTNDLVQYTMAADRGNALVSYLYQPANPAVLGLVGRVVEAAKARGIPVGVCGEAASDPILAALLVALGVNALSMSASFIPVARKVLMSVTRADLDALAAEVRGPWRIEGAETLYGLARDFLLARVPELERLQSFFMSP